MPLQGCPARDVRTQAATAPCSSGRRSCPSRCCACNCAFSRPVNHASTYTILKQTRENVAVLRTHVSVARGIQSAYQNKWCNRNEIQFLNMHHKFLADAYYTIPRGSANENYMYGPRIQDESILQIVCITLKQKRRGFLIVYVSPANRRGKTST